MVPAIRVDGLAKRYRLGTGPRRGRRTLPEALTEAARGVAGRLLGRRRPPPAEPDDFWALKDVSFEVNPGQVVGVIGRNGAGKSTLLKVLSRIVEPTAGRAEVNGRMGSLLEVGTGFHPELTGRENVYLNGSMLGMRRREIDKKFDEIVAFAEVERFLETPVKRYSSGMYVRLAFAVAAHLEPEILVIDEVLAVGDAAFQKRCLGKIGSAAGEGRTVLFVSHDMTNVSVLCDSVLLMDGGRVTLRGRPEAVIPAYFRSGSGAGTSTTWAEADAPGDDGVRVRAVRVSCDTAPGSDSFPLQGGITLAVEFAVRTPGLRVNPVFLVKNGYGTTVFSTANYEEPGWADRRYPVGRFTAECRVPAHLLNDGQYTADVLLVQEMRAVRARAEAAAAFRVHDDGTTRGGYVGDWLGIVRPRCGWTTRAAD
jgi:lipopolysaccharide transport system ATP-binding protein